VTRPARAVSTKPQSTYGTAAVRIHVPLLPPHWAETRRSHLGLTHVYSPLSCCTDRCSAANLKHMAH